MSDTSLRWLTVLVAAALVVVVGLGSLVGSAAVADGLRPDVERVLAENGLDGVQADLAGREVTLSEGSHADLADAEQLVAGVDGVRSVLVENTADSAGTPTPAADSPAVSTASLVLKVGARRVVVSGRVPDADAAASIKSGAALVFGLTVAGDVTVDRSTGSAPWVATLPDLFGDLVGVKGLQLFIGPTDVIRVSGTVESAAGRDKISRYIAMAVPDLAVTNDLLIDPGPLSKADATVLNEAVVLFEPASSVVTFTAAQPLDAVADVLRRNPRVRVQLGAHVATAAEGDLTRQRLAAVEGYLVAYGIDAGRISAVAHAAGGLVDVSPSAEQYRRVDLIVKES